MQRFQTLLLWTLYSLTSLLLCIWLAWHLLAQTNFTYPLWYSVLKVDQTIEQTTPHHRYKKRFDQTSRQERHRLFAEIVRAVQRNGKGLAQIAYRDRQGNVIDTLLTQSEIVHLNDVARFVNQLNWFSVVLSVIGLVCLALMFLRRVAMPRMVTLLVSAIAVAVVGVVVLALIGFTKVFYWLHPIVFPAKHQWFFYYEESLMSTLMKAPVLFAPIGAQLVLAGIVIWGLHLLVLKKSGLFKSV